MRGASKPAAKSLHLAGGQLVASRGKLALGQAGFWAFFPGSGCSWALAAPGAGAWRDTARCPRSPWPCVPACPLRAPGEPRLELELAALIPLHEPLGHHHPVFPIFSTILIFFPSVLRAVQSWEILWGKIFIPSYGTATTLRTNSRGAQTFPEPP